MAEQSVVAAVSGAAPHVPHVFRQACAFVCAGASQFNSFLSQNGFDSAHVVPNLYTHGLYTYSGIYGYGLYSYGWF